jgi:hypothetical protein
MKLFSILNSYILPQNYPKTPIFVAKIFQSGWHIELHSSVRPSLSPQILWHQLLLNYRADFFQTCTDDQVGCVDDRKEKIFSCDHFYQSYGPLFISLIKSCGINSSLTFRRISFKLAQMIK